MSAVRLAAASAAALGVWLWWRWRRRQEGPWLLRRVTVLDEAESGYRELDVLLGVDGRIERMGAGLKAPWGAGVIDGHRKLLLPGFVNAHTHSTQMLGRGLVAPLPLDLWILQMLTVTGAAMDRFESRARGAYLAALFCGVECLMSGCTAVQDHCFALSFEEVEAACKAYQDLGLRVFLAPMLNDDAVLGENYVPLASDAAARNARAAGRAPGGLGYGGVLRTAPGASDKGKERKALELWEECAKKLHRPEQGVNIVIGPVSVYSCSPDLLKGAAELRRKYGLNGHIHVLESRAQKLEATRRFQDYKGSAVCFLDATGFLEVPGTTTSLAHCCWLEEEEMQLLAKRRAVVVHNPVSNLRLGSGVCPVRRCLEQGLQVAVGVDGAMSSDGQDMTEALKLCCLLSPLTSVEYQRWLTAREALRCATRGGYEALGMDGRLAVGCAADVALWDLTALSLLPRGDAASLLVLGRPQQGPREAGPALHSAFVRGRRVVKQGVPMNCDLRWLRKVLWRHTVERLTGTVLDTRPSQQMQEAAEVEYRAALGLDGQADLGPWPACIPARACWDYVGRFGR